MQKVMGGGSGALGPLFTDPRAIDEGLQRDHLARVAVNAGAATTDDFEALLSDLDREQASLTKKQGKDFVESLLAAVEDEIGKGHPINLFGLVKLVPRYHTSGEREVLKEFGNADSGKMKKKYKPKVSLKATVFKRVKDQLPGAAKMQKVVDK